MGWARRLATGLIGEIPLRRLNRWKLAKFGGFPDWTRILDRPAWEQAKREADGPNVLVATSVSAFLPGSILESLLATALTIRKAKVHVLLCDTALPACLDSQVRWHKDPAALERDGLTKDLCATCYDPGRKMYDALGLTIHRYSDHVTLQQRHEAIDLARTLPLKDIPGYRHQGAAVGEHALAGALRFFARGTLDGEPSGEYVLRQYFQAALVTVIAARALMKKVRFKAAVFHHGIYVPQGLIGEAAREAGVRVVNWNAAYRKQCFIFSHGDTYHHTLMDEPVATWEQMPWDAARETRLTEYLKSRWQGTQDWIWFHNRPQEGIAAIEREIGVDFSKPCVGLLTNVIWDAQLHYPANAFPSMTDWILGTIDHFAKRPELQLIIRVHPAEVTGTLPSRQPAVAEIRKARPNLPKNIIIIPPESNVSTYAAMTQCDSVLIYGTKTGVELTSLGIPVVVAGEAWVRNKGITIDAKTAAEYYEILGRLPLKRRMDETQVQRARRYAYHFFFRRMIPIEAVEAIKAWPLYRVPDGAYAALQPGRSPGLDTVCRGILEGAPFVYE